MHSAEIYHLIDNIKIDTLKKNTEHGMDKVGIMNLSSPYN